MASAVLTDLQVTEQQYDSTVREDIELFRRQALLNLSGELTDDQFRPFRLRRGIYSQRQAGVQMIRTKVPGGLLTAQQMRQLGRVADEFGGGKGHLTTRQNMQYHFVPLAQVADLLHLLADVRLTTREACYNTVRNVTACPLAGVHPQEPFDVQPYARRLAFAFLHKGRTDNLPRKFKVAFAGCPEDCIASAINDVGLRAVIRDGERGFRMTVAGGLGPLPTESKVLHEFIPAEDVVRRVEAVIRIFNRHGNRGNKNKARLKFVMRESVGSTGCGMRSRKSTRKSSGMGVSQCPRMCRRISVVFSQVHHHGAQVNYCLSTTLHYRVLIIGGRRIRGRRSSLGMRSSQ